MRLSLKSIAGAVGLGAGMLIAAQTLGKIAYTMEIIDAVKIVTGIGIVWVFSYKHGHKLFLALTFAFSGIYGLAHIVYDLTSSRLTTSDLTYPIQNHMLQAVVSTASFISAFLAFTSTSQKLRKKKHDN